ncbi:MBOAT-2 domain-containing protein [Mycena kentingensis (nom. inval.)]|nr:MBOAT-2 domain-containing protein [Mycena kentingensis (nom. inval.)]
MTLVDRDWAGRADCARQRQESLSGARRSDGQLQAAELDAIHDAHLHVPPRRPVLLPNDPMSIDDLRRSADRPALIVLTRLCAGFVAIYYAALVVKSSPYRRLFFLPLLGIAVYALSVTSRVPLVDYYIGALLWISLVAASDHILLTDVQRELYVLGEKPIVGAGLRERMVWAARLLGDRRALGWVHEERQATPPLPAMSRPRFVMARLLRGTVALVLAEMTNAYNELYTPALYPDGPNLAPTKILLFAIPYVSYMVLLDALNDALAVAIRRARPIDCPSGTGPLRQLYSLRNFWGRVWHQQNRRLLTAHGKFLAHKLLRLRRGSVASAYTQLYAAFLISGLMHYLPEYVALRHWGGGGMRFFVLQAVAITLEDVLGRYCGVKGGRGWRLLGYGWVWAWFALTAPPWLDPLLRAGVFEPFLRSYALLPWLRAR